MNGVLGSLLGRLGRWVLLRTSLWLAGLLGALALGAVLLDAAVDLPEDVRVLALWVLSGSALVVIGLGLWSWRKLSETAVAAQCERQDRALGNRLTNAVLLARQSGDSGVNEFLRREAIALGRQAAERFELWPLVRARLRAPCRMAGAAAAAWLVTGFAAGGLLHAVLPRFTDPHGDHPPFSTRSFEVTPRSAEVLYGGQMEVRAALRPASGAERLWLVTRTGGSESRSLMFLAPDKTFFQSLVNLREPGEYYVTDGRGRSHRYPLQIKYTPKITLVEVTTVFPEYTGKPAKTAKLADEPQAVPEDTRIQFRIVSNRPLQSGLLRLTPVLGGKPTEIPLQPEPGSNSVTGGFTLSESVVFSLSVKDVRGLVCADPRQGRFNLLPDERPRLFVIEPGRDAAAAPSVKVPVRVEATDDYAVTRVAWLRGFNRSLERPFNLKLALKNGPRTVEAEGAFDLSRLGVRPGDVIEYYFEAADNYPKGPNLALSKVYRLEIISQEQYETIMRQAAARKSLFENYFKLNAWLRRLAERARSLDQQAAADSRPQAQALEKELEKYLEALGKALGEPPLFEADEAFQESLKAQQAALQQASQSLQKALGGGRMQPNELKALADKLSELANLSDEQVERPARQIAAVARLMSHADAFVRLAAEEATLAKLLRRFGESGAQLSRSEELEVRELAYQQRRIQGALRALLDALPEAATHLPDEPQYAQARADVQTFLAAVATAKIEDDLTESAQALEKPEAKPGWLLAVRAAENMDRLISKCQGMSQDLEQGLEKPPRFWPKLQKCLASTLQAIQQAMNPGMGKGQGGRDGYSLFNDQMALYGPNMPLSGEQAGGRGEREVAGASRTEPLKGQPGEPAPNPSTPGRVRLQPDAKFPLRYRELVGEYFRVIAESAAGSGEDHKPADSKR